MFSIQQGIAASDGNTPGSHSYLFDDCEDLLNIRLAGEDTSAAFNTKDTPFAAFNQFRVYEPYTESGPSSVHPGDSHDDYERGGSHTSSKDEMNSLDSAAATGSSAGRLKRKRNAIPSVQSTEVSVLALTHMMSVVSIARSPRRELRAIRLHLHLSGNHSIFEAQKNHQEVTSICSPASHALDLLLYFSYCEALIYRSRQSA